MQKLPVALDHQHTFVVHGAGLDEVAIHGETQVAEIKTVKLTTSP